MSWGSFDFSEFEEMAERVHALVESNAIEQFYHDCAKELAGRLLAVVIKRTPVGQKPVMVATSNAAKNRIEKVRAKYGDEKAEKFSRRIQVGKKGSKVYEQYQKYWSGYTGGTLRRGWTGGQAMDGAAYAKQMNVARSGDSYVIEVTNSVQYASYVENGHRQKPGRYVPALGKQLKAGWVNGQFMLKISTQEIEQMTPGILERKIENFLKEHLQL